MRPRRRSNGASASPMPARSSTGSIHHDFRRHPLVPLDALDPKAVMGGRDGRSGEPLYVICRSGSRAMRACEEFRRCGYDNVVVIEGGTLAWERAGLPVV